MESSQARHFVGVASGCVDSDKDDLGSKGGYSTCCAINSNPQKHTTNRKQLGAFESRAHRSFKETDRFGTVLLAMFHGSRKANFYPLNLRLGLFFASVL
jgi:hypothetical protein